MIGKHLSVGANMTLLSGNINRTNQVIFSDFYNDFHDNNSEKLELIGINFDYGLQYSTTFKHNWFLNIGASLNSRNNYGSKYEYLSPEVYSFQ